MSDEKPKEYGPDYPDISRAKALERLADARIEMETLRRRLIAEITRREQAEHEREQSKIEVQALGKLTDEFAAISRAVQERFANMTPLALLSLAWYRFVMRFTTWLLKIKKG